LVNKKGKFTLINDIKDLELEKIEKGDLKKLEEIIQEKLGISFLSMSERLSNNLKDKAEELTLSFRNIAPNGDYSQLLEDNDSMATFLKESASNVDNWNILGLDPVQGHPELIHFTFGNKGVDDGQTLTGHVFINKSGVVRHSFVSVED